MGVPVHDAPSIRQTPLYVRYRFRFVHELIKANKAKAASKQKAMAVFDIGQL